MPVNRKFIANPPPWPNGARCAVAFTFDMDADSILHLAHHKNANNLVTAMSALQYGPRVAMPRILDFYRQMGVKQTFFIPSWCIERYPEPVKAALGDGHEVAHHSYLHEHPNELSRERELYWFRRANDVLEKVTGSRAIGYRAPSYRFSVNTLDILLQEGIRYDSSLFGDEIPYRLTNGKSSLIELPSHYALDDWNHFQFSREFEYRMPIKAPADAMDVYRSEFDAAWRYGGMWISIWHPFLSGRLARFEMIADLMEYMAGKGGVWFATLRDIAAHIEGLIAAGTWTPRTDKLPQYPGPIPELEAGS